MWAPRAHRCWKYRTSASSRPSPTKPCDSSSLPNSLAFPSCTYLKGTNLTCVFKWIWVTFPSFRLGPARCEHLGLAVQISAAYVEHLWRRRLTQPNPKSYQLLPSRALDGSVEEEAKFHTRLQPYTQTRLLGKGIIFAIVGCMAMTLAEWSLLEAQGGGERKLPFKWAWKHDRNLIGFWWDLDSKDRARMVGKVQAAGVFALCSTPWVEWLALNIVHLLLSKISNYTPGDPKQLVSLSISSAASACMFVVILINDHFRNLNWRYVPYIRPM